MIGFAVLPIRGCLYTLSDDPVYIVAVQLLDGIGAGIFGVLWVTVVADLTKGTGRYNVTLGAIATAQSGIPNDVAPGAVVSGYPAIDNKLWLRCCAVFNKLPELAKAVRKFGLSASH